jgi:hypothetical protein
MSSSQELTRAHSVSRLLHEIVNYPSHVARTNSPAYTKIHEEMVDKKDLPCLACGVRKSKLNDPKANPHGAKQLETHHHIIEWALAHAMDIEKFNDRIVRHMRSRPHHDPIYDKDFTEAQMYEWVDHHPDNLWVLCDVHHRHTFFGIHEITMPAWGPQDLVRDDFEYIPADGDGPSPSAKKALAFRPPSAREGTASKTVRRRVVVAK